jgi:hypothetical protein
MTQRIAVIGAGGIGARHLQGLMQRNRAIAIDVIDPSDLARGRACHLAAEIDSEKATGITFHANLFTLRPPDLAIVATNARERANVVSDLLEAGARRFILEKVLFTRLADYDRIHTLFAQANAVAWVNCARRAYPRASELFDKVRGKRFDYSVEGAGWGLGCNVIHHLDEFAMLNGDTEITLDGDALLPGMIDAKRSGYIEFLGTLRGTAPNGSTFSAICEPGEPGDRVVSVACDGIEMRVSQTQQTLSISDSRGTRSEPFPIPFQSEATAYHVDAILDGRAPKLTAYANAATLHRRMLAIFLDHLRRATGNDGIEECPIT